MTVLSQARGVWGLLASRLRERRLASIAESRMQAGGPPEPGRYRIAVYFADAPINLYQLRQWYGPLAAVDAEHPVLVLARSAASALALVDEAPVRVQYLRRIADVEALLDAQDLQVVLYVNQNASNFRMMRYGQRFHVFMNHGESDKAYMASNQQKAYDYTLIAGEAARERLDRSLWNYDSKARTIEIGRPQLDFVPERPQLYPDDDRTVVLYAPTWEGDRPSMAYGSLASHGVELARAVLASPRHRLVFRPHPRTGVSNAEHGSASKRIASMIADANAAHPDAQHLYDADPVLGWQILAADVAVLDVSALVSDRLAVGRPLLVSRPVSPEAEIDESGYLSACEWLDASDGATMLARIDEVAADAGAHERMLQWTNHYFGDVTPGAATQRFQDALTGLLEAAEAKAARYADPPPRSQ